MTHALKVDTAKFQTAGQTMKTLRPKSSRFNQANRAGGKEVSKQKNGPDSLAPRGSNCFIVEPTPKLLNSKHENRA